MREKNGEGDREAKTRWKEKKEERRTEKSDRDEER